MPFVRKRRGKSRRREEGKSTARSLARPETPNQVARSLPPLGQLLAAPCHSLDPPRPSRPTRHELPRHVWPRLRVLCTFSSREVVRFILFATVLAGSLVRLSVCLSVTGGGSPHSGFHYDIASPGTSFPVNLKDLFISVSHHY